MTGFDAYRTYTALKTHFTTDYDFHKYNGKIRVFADTYDARHDKYFFEKLGRYGNEVQDFLLASFTKFGPGIWIKDLVQKPIFKDNFVTWKKRNESLSYEVERELSQIRDIKKAIRSQDGYHPELLTRYVRQEVSLETLIIMDALTGCFTEWNKVFKMDPVWENTFHLAEKYRSFMTIDKKKMQGIVYALLNREIYSTVDTETQKQESTKDNE
jgi:T4 gene Gp59 loader of gp41 DNA helicase